MSKPDDTPAPGGQVAFTVHDEDDGSSGEFSVQRGSSLADAVTAAYAALQRTPCDGDRLRGDGAGAGAGPIAPDANDTVAAYLARGGVTVWLLAGPTGGACG